MRARWIIAGRVQGVGFRAWVVVQARSLGLDGWVRNRANGSVEVEAAGTAAALAELAERLGRGPRHAVVTSCTEHPPENAAPASGFEIRRDAGD